MLLALPGKWRPCSLSLSSLFYFLSYRLPPCTCLSLKLERTAAQWILFLSPSRVLSCGLIAVCAECCFRRCVLAACSSCRHRTDCLPFGKRPTLSEYAGCPALQLHSAACCADSLFCLSLCACLGTFCCVSLGALDPWHCIGGSWLALCSRLLHNCASLHTAPGGCAGADPRFRRVSIALSGLLACLIDIADLPLPCLFEQALLLSAFLLVAYYCSILRCWYWCVRGLTRLAGGCQGSVHVVVTAQLDGGPAVFQHSHKGALLAPFACGQTHKRLQASDTMQLSATASSFVAT